MIRDRADEEFHEGASHPFILRERNSTLLVDEIDARTGADRIGMLVTPEATLAVAYDKGGLRITDVLVEHDFRDPNGSWLQPFVFNPASRPPISADDMEPGSGWPTCSTSPANASIRTKPSSTTSCNAEPASLIPVGVSCRRCRQTSWYIVRRGQYTKQAQTVVQSIRGTTTGILETNRSRWTHWKLIGHRATTIRHPISFDGRRCERTRFDGEHPSRYPPMNTSIPKPSINIKLPIGWLLPVSLTAALGLAISPAFTFGTFMKGRNGAIVAGLLALAWAFVQWRMLWADYWWNPEIGEFFKAADGRVNASASAAAFAGSIVHTACCLFAGRISRWLYDHQKQAFPPLGIACCAFALVLYGQWNAMATRIDYAYAQGGESGRVNVAAENGKVINAVIKDIAQTDREKLLLGYSQSLTARRGLGGDKATIKRFDEYVAQLADKCEGEEEVAICDIQTLRDIRSSQKYPDFSR